MNTKDIVKKITNIFDRLEKRQKMLIFVLIASLLFSFYYNTSLKPHSKALWKARKELVGIQNRIVELKSELPDMKKEIESLDTSKKKLAILKERLTDLESELPTQRRIPQLLGELAHQASGYGIDFISIRPKQDKKKAEYAELVIEIKLNSTYTDFANYLNRLESISQFLETRGILMEEMEDGFRGSAVTTLTLSTLLGESEAAQAKIEKPKEAVPLKIERNPFISKFMPVRKEAKKEDALRLSGIIATGKHPTAIIDDEVYRVGDFIDEKEVKEILPNMVMLSDGRKSTVLTLESE